MSLPLKEIDKLAHLARLALDGEQLEAMQHDLQKIVSFIDVLMEVDVDGVEAMAHAVPIEIPLREDELQQSVGRVGLAQSAGYTDGFVAVPKIIE